MTAPALVLVAHGSSTPESRDAVASARDRVAAHRPGVAVVLAFIEHDEPRLSAALGTLPTGPAVLVPYLMADAFHVRTDLRSAAGNARRAGRPVVVANTLGEHPRLPDVARQLLADAGSPGDEAAVLASPGTNDEDANEVIRRLARAIGEQRTAPVVAAFASTAAPSLTQALNSLPPPVAVLRWVLAPGRFAASIARQATDAGARCTAILGTHPVLAEIVWDRYDEAAEALSRRNES